MHRDDAKNLLKPQHVNQVLRHRKKQKPKPHRDQPETKKLICIL